MEKVKAVFTAIKMNATEELQFIDSYEKIDQVIARVSAIEDGDRCRFPWQSTQANGVIKTVL